jgi:hypothetical protein
MFLRIYKNDDTLEHVADPVVVQNIMLHTIKCDEKITEIQREVLL